MNLTARHFIKTAFSFAITFSIVFAVFVYSQKNDSIEQLNKNAEAAGSTLDLGMVPSLDVDVPGPYETKNYENFPLRYSWSRSDPKIQSNGADPSIIQFGPSVTNQTFDSTYVQNRPSSALNKLDWDQDVTAAGQRIDFTNIIREGETQTLVGNSNNVRGYYYVAGNNSPSVDCSSINTTRNGFNTGASTNLYTVNAANQSTVKFRLGRGKILSLNAVDGNAIAIVESRIYYDNVCTFNQVARGSTFEECSNAGDITRNSRLSNVSMPISLVVVYNKTSKSWRVINQGGLINKSALVKSGTRVDAVLWGFTASSSFGPTLTLGAFNNFCDGSRINDHNLNFSRGSDGRPAILGALDKQFGGKNIAVLFLGIKDVFGTPIKSNSGISISDDVAQSGDAEYILNYIEPNVVDNSINIYLRGPVRANSSSLSYIINLKSADNVANIGRIQNINGFDKWVSNFGNIGISYANQVFIREYRTDFDAAGLLEENTSQCRFIALNNTVASVHTTEKVNWGSRTGSTQGYIFNRIPFDSCIGQIEKFNNLLYINLNLPNRDLTYTRGNGTVQSCDAKTTASSGPFTYTYRIVNTNEAGYSTAPYFYADRLINSNQDVWNPNSLSNADRKWVAMQGDYNTVIGGWTAISSNPFKCSPNIGGNPSIPARNEDRVPLIQQGHYLTFVPSQGGLAATAGSGFYDKSDNPVYSRQLINSEVQDAPIRSLYSSLMSGVYFSENNIQKNIIVIGDNGGMLGSPSAVRWIWLGGENMNTKPKLSEFKVECDQETAGARGNPYKLKFTIKTEATDASMLANYMRITPINITGVTAPTAEQYYNSVFYAHVAATNPGGEYLRSYNFSSPGTFVNYGAGVRSLHALAKNPGYRNSVTGLAPTPIANDVIYQVRSSQFVTSGVSGTLTFFVDFNHNNDFYKQFYNSPVGSAKGFNLYLFAQDTRLVGESIEKSFAFDPFEKCASPFFMTSNGDFRSNEFNQNITPVRTISSNKFWQAENSTLQSFREKFNPFAGLSGSSSSNLPKVSDFGFEYNNAGTGSACNNDQSVFCNIIPSTNSLSAELDIYTQLNNSLQNNTKLRKETLNGTTGTLLTTTTAVPPSYSGNTVYKLDLSKLNTQFAGTDVNTFFFIDLGNNIADLIIVDSLVNSPNNVIVRCQAVRCSMRIQSVTAYSNFDMNTKNYTTSIAESIKTKSRLYLNYAVGEQAKNPVKFDPNPPTPNPNPRLVSLFKDPSSTTKNNFYLGGVITNGYLYRSMSENTDILKGFVIARGMINRATGSENKDMIFKDFPNPFVYIDYDPKFLLTFRDVFSNVTNERTQKYIGL